MAEGKWISYLRVSTGRQGRSGLGLEAQRKAVEEFLNGGDWHLVKEFVEVESGKKTDRHRPVLTGALKSCRLYGAKMIIAKLDRLSRNAHFLLGLKEAGVDFVAADMPTANRLTVGIMAMVAEEEGRMISERTKQALAAARRRGVQLGGYNKNPKLTASARKAGQEANRAKAVERMVDLAPTIAELQATGATSLRAIAMGLTNDESRLPAAGIGHRPRSCASWHARCQRRNNWYRTPFRQERFHFCAPSSRIMTTPVPLHRSHIRSRSVTGSLLCDASSRLGNCKGSRSKRY